MGSCQRWLIHCKRISEATRPRSFAIRCQFQRCCSSLDSDACGKANLPNVNDASLLDMTAGATARGSVSRSASLGLGTFVVQEQIRSEDRSGRVSWLYDGVGVHCGWQREDQSRTHDMPTRVLLGQEERCLWGE